MATKIADDGKSIRAHMTRLGLERNIPSVESKVKFADKTRVPVPRFVFYKGTNDNRWIPARCARCRSHYEGAINSTPNVWRCEKTQPPCGIWPSFFNYEDICSAYGLDT